MAASQHRFQSVVLFSPYLNRVVKNDGPVCAKGKNSCCYFDSQICILLQPTSNHTHNNMHPLRCSICRQNTYCCMQQTVSASKAPFQIKKCLMNVSFIVALTNIYKRHYGLILFHLLRRPVRNSFIGSPAVHLQAQDINKNRQQQHPLTSW